MPKELLPIIDKPLIQYAVEEAVEAGLTEMVFVTGRTKRAIEDHFDHNPELETLLEKRGKKALAEEIRDIVPKDVHCIFVRQPEALGLGHAIMCAQPVVGREPFAVLLPDDFMAGPTKPTSELVRHYEQTGIGAISVQQISNKDLGNYGVISPVDSTGGRVASFRSIVEKPDPNKAPSNLAAVGRYVFPPEILDHLQNIERGVGGEFQLTDAINSLAQRQVMDAIQIDCLRYDCGSKLGYFEAIVEQALARPEFKNQAIEVLSKKLSDIRQQEGAAGI